MSSKNTYTSLEKRYLVYKAFSHLWFVGAIWLLFYRIFMTDQSVGILDAISFGFGLLAEIPSGALADHFGRKKIAIIGIIAGSIGMSLQGFAGGYALILTGQMILTAGFAFVSGADEALFYDALSYDESSNQWKRLVSKGNQVRLVTTLLSYLVGGYLYTISPRLPFYASILTLGAAVTLWGIPESKHKLEGAGKLITQYFQSLKDGVAQLGHKQIIGYLPLIIIVQGFFYSFGYGLLRPILQTRFDFGASAGAWVLFVCGGIAFVLQRIQLRYIDILSEKLSISVIVLITFAMLLLGALPLGHIGFLVILTIYVGEYLLDPLISSGLNTHISSNHRATALSTASFLKSLTYVIAAPIIGYLNVHGNLHYYMITMAALFVVALLIYLSKVKEKPLEQSAII